MSGGTRIVQLIDLEDLRSNPNGTLTRNHQEVDRGEMCYFASPYDMPMYMRFWRRLTDLVGGSRDNLGSTAELDLFPWGVKVYVRHDRSRVKGVRGKIHIIIEDSDGRETVATYE